jgi:NADH-quinone oxidoreductase subunit J
LIVTFFLGALILLDTGAELVAIILILVYVGAISVLFLVVIMLLNIKKVEVFSLIISYIPIGLVIGFLLLMEIMYILKIYISKEINMQYLNWVYEVFFYMNSYNVGYVLYLFFVHYFLILSVVLLVSMVGAVMLLKNK